MWRSVPTTFIQQSGELLQYTPVCPFSFASTELFCKRYIPSQHKPQQFS